MALGGDRALAQYVNVPHEQRDTNLIYFMETAAHGLRKIIEELDRITTTTLTSTTHRYSIDGDRSVTLQELHLACAEWRELIKRMSDGKFTERDSARMKLKAGFLSEINTITEAIAGGTLDAPIVRHGTGAYTGLAGLLAIRTAFVDGYELGQEPDQPKLERGR